MTIVPGLGCHDLQGQLSRSVVARFLAGKFGRVRIHGRAPANSLIQTDDALAPCAR